MFIFNKISSGGPGLFFVVALWMLICYALLNNRHTSWLHTCCLFFEQLASSIYKKYNVILKGQFPNSSTGPCLFSVIYPQGFTPDRKSSRPDFRALLSGSVQKAGFLLGIFVVFSFSNLDAATIISTGTGGAWSNPATWVGRAVPVAGDDVTIASGAMVIIDSDVTVGTLTVSGTLQFNELTPQVLTANNIITVNAKGIFRSAPSGTVKTHQLIAQSSIINNGTIDFSSNLNETGVEIIFTGSGNAIFSCSDAVLTNLRKTNGLMLNKGTSAASVLSFMPGNTFQVLSNGDSGASGFLSIVNGTFNIIGSRNFSNPVFNTDGNYTIPATGGFWLGNQNATVIAMNGTVTVLGELKIANGTYSVGNSGSNSLEVMHDGQFKMSGGILNISGKLKIDGGAGSVSGGKINLASRRNLANVDPTIHISANARFEMYGDPLITLAFPNSNPIPSNDIQILDGSGFKSVKGGVIQLGTEATPAGSTFLINANTILNQLTAFSACTIHAVNTSDADVTNTPVSSLPVIPFDLIAPELTAPAKLTIQCGETIPAAYTTIQEFTNAGGLATDNCTLNPASFKLINQVQSKTNCPYTISRTYEISDVSGNVGKAEQQIVVEGEVETATEPEVKLKSAMAACTASTGVWNSTSTWSCGHIPTTLDDITIPNGVTVTIDAAAVCNNITIDAGGTLNYTGTNTLTVNGNWTNNGTYNGGTNGIVEFAGNSPATISGSAVTNFYDFTLNKGSGISDILSVGNNIAISNLTFANGVLKINAGTTSINDITNLYNTIPKTAGLVVSGGTLNTGNFSIENEGLIQVISGAANFGTNSGNSVHTQIDGAFIVSGGTVGIAGRLENTASGTLAPGVPSGILISDGTITLAKVGNGLSSVGSLNVTSAGTFNFNGGTIVFQNASTATTELDLGLLNGTGTKNISGGTFQFGNGSPSGETYNIISEIPLYNLKTNGNANIVLGSTLILGNPLTLNGASKLFLNGNSIQIPVSATGTYTFPITDASGTSIPVTVNLTSGSGAIAAGAYIEIKTFDTKYPDNDNVANYLNRYWTVTTSGITSPIYTVNATYLSSDLHNTPVHLTAASYLSPTWTKIAGATIASNTISLSSNSTSLEFTALDAPTVTIANTDPEVICNNTSLTLTTTTTADPPALASYSWSSNPAGFTGSTQDLTITPTIAGTYTFTITVTDGNGFTATDATTVTVNPKPTVTPVINQIFCNGVNVPLTTLSGPVTGTTFIWTNNNSAIGLAANGTGNVPAFTPTNATALPITSTISVVPEAAGCSGAVVTYTITVNPLPTATIGGTTSVCQSAASPYVTFTGASGTTPYTFTYTINGGSNQTITTISGNSITVAAPTGTSGTFNYTLVSVQDANTCSQLQTGTATITVNPTPTVNAPGNQTYCNGTTTSPITLTGAPPGVVFDITGGVAIGLTNQSGVSEVPSFTTQAGTATITITPKANGCAGVPVTFKITVQTTPTAGTIDPNQTVCPNSLPTTFNSTLNGTGSGVISYLWEKSIDNGSNWTLIAGITTASYSSPALGQTTRFRRTTVSTLNGVLCYSLPTTYVEVIVVDITPPTYDPLSIPSLTINSNGNCTFDADPSKTGSPTVSDNCTPKANLIVSYNDITTVPTPPLCKYPFTISRIWKITDETGNFTTATQTITVRDVSAPQITSVPINKNIECGIDYTPVFPTDYPTVSDCSTVSITYSDLITNGNCAGRATVSRVWKATDCSGNYSTATQTININDTTAPSVTSPTTTVFTEHVGCPDDIPDETLFIDKIMATDNCGTVTITLTNTVYAGLGSKPGFCPTGLTRYYRVSDNCDNAVTIEHHIIVDSECDCALCVNTPFDYANLETTPVWYSQNWSRGGKSSACCSVVPVDDNCISFFVWLGVDQVGLKFSIESGANPSGSLFYKIDCEGVGTPVGEGRCLTGGQWYTLSFCKPGNNKNVYKIEAINGATSAPDITTRVDCDYNLTVTGLKTSTITWTDPSGNGYEQYLTPSYGSATPTFYVPEADKNSVPPFIDYKVCGQIQSLSACGANYTDCTTVRVNILPKIQISLDIQPDKICKGQIPIITPTVEPFDNDYIYHWYDKNGVEIPNVGSTFSTTDEGDYFVKVVKMDGISVCNESNLLPFTIAYNKTGPAFLPLPSPLTIYCDDSNRLTAVNDWLASVKATYIGADGKTPVEIIATPSYPSITNMSCGTVTVTFTAVDLCPNTSTATSTITIIDNKAPTISGSITSTTVQGCTSTDGPAAVTTVAELEGLGLIISDCSADDLLTVTHADVASGSCPIIVTRTYTVSDQCSNSSTVTQTIRIADTTPPVITCPTAATGGTDFGQCFATGVSLGTATALDNCSTVSVTNNAPAQFPVGVTTVTWTATDACGNVATCTQRVTILDNNQPPTITCPGSYEEMIAADQCSKTGVNPGAPIVWDNCPNPALTYTLTGATTGSGIGTVSNTTFNVGVTTVTYTVTDAGGSTASCSFSVWIKRLDIPPASIACPGNPSSVNVISGCDALVTVNPPVITDVCQTATYTITNDYTGTATATATYPVGTTTVTWTIRDNSGNVTTCVQTVTVIDNLDPVITTCPVSVSEDIAPDQCTKSDVTIAPLNYTDNCSSTLTYTIVDAVGGTTSGTGIISSTYSYGVGANLITYVVTDASGNSATCTFTVTIRRLDIPPATIACPSNPLPVNVTSGCSAMVTVDPLVITDVCHTATYTITNDYTGTATATATYPVGTTTVTWTIRDNSGSVTTCVQTVTVIDDLDPVITACPASVSEDIAPDQCTKSDVTIDPLIYTDNCSSTLTYTIVDAVGGTTSGTGIISSTYSYGVGANLITYVVTDASGNSATCTFTVTIRRLDIPPASIACPGNPSPVNIISGCDALVTVNPPVITDVCQTATYTITNDYTGTATATATYPIGTTTVTWTIIDNSGSVTTCVQTVTVIDNITPLFTSCPTSFSKPADFEKLYATLVDIPTQPGFIADNCTTTLTWSIVHETNGTVSSSVTTGINYVPTPYPQLDLGVNTIDYVLSDDSGNTSTCTFTITITAKPVIDCPADIVTNTTVSDCTSSLNPGFPELISGTQTITWTWTITDPTGLIQDSGTFIGSDAIPGPPDIGDKVFQEGTSTVTWTATNLAGTTSCTHTVTVEDKEPPTFTPATITECVDMLVSAVYSVTSPNPNSGIDPNLIVSPSPDYYTFKAGDESLDLIVLDDNCCGTASLTIDWRIDFTNVPDPLNPSGPVLVHPSISGTGQPSTYIDLVSGLAADIFLWGDGVNFTTITHFITYKVTDCHGNIADEQTKPIIIKPRPEIIKMN